LPQCGYPAERSVATERSVGPAFSRVRRVATDLFARRGYGGTSMSEIAHRVGIRKASIYNYYDSKADLMVELLEDSLVAWQVACRIEFSTEVTVEEKLSSYLKAALQFTRDNPQAVGIIRLAAGQIPGELRQRVKQTIDRHDADWQQALNALFQTAIERGEIEDTDLADLGLFWSVFVHGLLINQIFAIEQGDAVMSRLEPLWRFFWRGLSGREPTTELHL
jgi:AcrR family transcriptional regulator